MALEAVVFHQNPFGCGAVRKDFCSHLVRRNPEEGAAEWFDNEEGSPSFEGTDEKGQPANHWDSSVPDQYPLQRPDCYYPSSEEMRPAAAGSARPKRRRVRCRKNHEDIETQRRTHIAVERNRRRQMNDHLAVLRSLMPDSFVQRGDQASIIGGAINFVKELEQRLHFLGTAALHGQESEAGRDLTNSPVPFSEFFPFPQFSTTAPPGGDGAGSPPASIADVEVGMVESHVSIKIRTTRRRRQLLGLLSELPTLGLAVLHLNVTTRDRIVLYSLSARVEEDCRLGSVDQISRAVHRLLCEIQREAMVDL